jgi:hypothetical protein
MAATAPMQSKCRDFRTILCAGGDDSDNLERSSVGSEKNDCGPGRGKVRAAWKNSEVLGDYF